MIFHSFNFICLIRNYFQFSSKKLLLLKALSLFLPCVLLILYITNSIGFGLNKNRDYS